MITRPTHHVRHLKEETPWQGQGKAGGRRRGKRGGKKKLLIIVGAVAVLGAVAFFFLKPSGDAAAEEVKLVKGAVVVADPVHINLADGHFLKLGMALQATADVHEEPDPSEALDIAIEIYTGKEIKELQNAKERHHLKEELLKKVMEKYTVDEVVEVMEIYFTEFVVQ